MWSDALAWAERHKATLAAAGLPLHTPVRRSSSLLSALRGGVIELALPELSTPAGRLQATLLGGLMGESPEAVERLFTLLLPRLVAHELGHALRAEAGCLGGDPLAEEQVAERVACLLSRPFVDRAAALAVLTPIADRLGGLEVAAALHRDADQLAALLGPPADAAAVTAAAESLRRDYYRDVHAYLRLTLAWTWLDLTLDREDTLDALRHDHLRPAALRPSRPSALAG